MPLRLWFSSLVFPFKERGEIGKDPKGQEKERGKCPQSAQPAHLGWDEGFSAAFCRHPYSIKDCHKSPGRRIIESIRSAQIRIILYFLIGSK